MLSFRRTPVTLILTAVAVAAELVCTVRPGMRHYFYNDLRLGILSWVWSGQWWRPLTTTLLHGDLIHVGFNVYWLVLLGGWLEQHLGRLRYLLLTILFAYVSTIPEFLISNWSAPLDAQQGMVGLSGVVFGWIGWLWLGRRWRPEFERICPQSTVEIFVFWFGFCWVATYMGLFHAANVAHAAGGVFGALYAAAWYAPKYRIGYRLGAAAGTLLLLATLLGVPGHPLYEKHRAVESPRRTCQAFPRMENRARRLSFPRFSLFSGQMGVSFPYPGMLLSPESPVQKEPSGEVRQAKERRNMGLPIFRCLWQREVRQLKGGRSMERRDASSRS